MQHKIHTPISTRIVEALAILACLLYAIGAISQQPAPTFDELHAQWSALNTTYWKATTNAERDTIAAQTRTLGDQLTDMLRGQLAENTKRVEAMIPKLELALIVTQPTTATYRTHGPAILNDLAVTPGAAGTTPQATLCSPSFHTGTVRNVPESLKQRVCRNYGIARADCTGQKVEIDHLISLELGGTNDEANLWPQPYAPKPAAKEKDIVENWLHRQVCSNAIPLTQAQHEIATDWYQVYLDLNTPPAPQAKVFVPGAGDSVSCGKGADCPAVFMGTNDAAGYPIPRGEPFACADSACNYFVSIARSYHVNGDRICTGFADCYAAERTASMILNLQRFFHGPDLIGAAR